MQRGGEWSYGITGISSDDRREAFAERRGIQDQQIDQYGVLPPLEGYGSVFVRSINLSGPRPQRDIPYEVSRAAFVRITGTDHTHINVDLDNELLAEEVVFGNASLSIAGDVLCRVVVNIRAIP